MSEQHFDTPRPVRLQIKLASGDIHVASVEGERTTVSLEGSPKLEQATRVHLAGDRLLVEQRRGPTGWFGHLEDPLRLRAGVPHGSTVEVATASGHVTLEGTFGGLKLTSASGDVVLTGELRGDAHVKTVSGEVRLARVGGDLVGRTVSGDLVAESIEGSVSVKSVSGDVRVGSLREGKATLRSVSGDVELGVAQGTTIDLDATSASGELTSEIPLSPRPGQGAGPKVVIRGNTVSGDLRIFRAA